MTAVATLGLLLIVVLPLSFAIGSIVVNSDRIMKLIAAVPTFHVPPAPDWRRCRRPVEFAGPCILRSAPEVETLDGSTN